MDPSCKRPLKIANSDVASGRLHETFTAARVAKATQEAAQQKQQFFLRQQQIQAAKASTSSATPADTATSSRVLPVYEQSFCIA